MADQYLPHVVFNLPISFVMNNDGTLRDAVRHYVRLGVVRVIAGPDRCHVVVDIRRPYWRPQRPKYIAEAN